MLTLKWGSKEDGEFHEKLVIGDVYAQAFIGDEPCGKPVRFYLKGAPELCGVDFPKGTLMFPCMENDWSLPKGARRGFTMGWIDGEGFCRNSLMMIVTKSAEVKAWNSPFDAFNAGAKKSNWHGDFRYNDVQGVKEWFNVENYPFLLAVTPQGDMYAIDRESRIACTYKVGAVTRALSGLFRLWYRTTYALYRLWYRIRGIDIQRRSGQEVDEE